MTDHYIPEDILQALPRDGATKKILIMTDNKTQDLEFFYPYYRFIEEGYRVDVATPNGGAFKGEYGLGLKETRKISETDSTDYQMLYISGGKAPAHLKKIDEALTLARHFVESGKPVAAFCHGPQVLAAAGVIQGCNIACWPDVDKEIEAAGATFISAEAVADGLFITGRWPADLPHHMAATLRALKDYEDYVDGDESFHATPVKSSGGENRLQ